MDRRPTADEAAGIGWWNQLPEPARAFWLRQAGPSVATAWARYQQLVGAPGTEDIQSRSGKGSGNFVLRLMVLARAAGDGDQSAQAELRRTGDVLNFSGGAVVMTEVQHLVRAFQRNHPEMAKGRDLAALIVSYWNHIDSWATR